MNDGVVVARMGSQLSDLPPELVFNILTRLPVSSLVQAAKYTCKLWYSIINDPVFADRHLKRVLNKPPGHLYSLYSHNSPSLYFTQDPTLAAIKLPGDLGNRHKYTSFASCRGLITYSTFNPVRSIYVCNPITGDRVKLPCNFSEPQLSKPRFYLWAFAGFGYALLNHKYKYIQCFSPNATGNPFRAYIFTLGEKSWRQLDVPFNNIHRSPPSDAVYCNGVVYWAWGLCLRSPGSQYNVISFDLDNHKFRCRRVIPNDAERFSINQYLAKLGETIAFVTLTQHNIHEVWMLVDEAKDIWDVKYRIPHPAFGLSFTFKLSELCDNGDLYAYGTRLDDIIHDIFVSPVIKRYNAKSQTSFMHQLPLPDDMDSSNAGYQSYAIIISHVGCLISPSKIVAAATTNPPLLEDQ